MMDSNSEVTHSGIVSEVNRQGITVKILVKSGCASCQIKGSCNMTDQADKELFIECDPGMYKAGDPVLVRLKTSQGMNALLLGYVLPLILLIVSLIVFISFNLGEGLSALLALATLIPYYFGLYLFRNQIKKKFTYFVNPLNN